MPSENETIKLLVITPSLHCGGSERYVSLLCNYIDTKKITVVLAVLNNARPFYSINSNIKIVDLNTKHVRNGLFKIKKLVKEEQPHIIYSIANHLNIYLAFFRNSFPQKTVMIARETSIVSINTKRAKFPFLFNWLIKKYYHRFDKIICQSQYMQQDLVGHYHIPKEKTIVINNPVIENLQQKDVLPQKNKFITVARLSEEKGIERLIHAVSKLDKPFTYQIVGDGKLKKQLHELINSLQLQDKVFLRGQNSSPFDGLEDAGFFLMGSYYEGFPNAVLEANALGIPVIAFDAPGGINEIIKDGENGMIVTNENEFPLAIEKAITTDFNREQIKNNTLKRFSLQTITQFTQNLLVQLYQQKSIR